MTEASERRRLGRSNVTVTALGVGTASLGGVFGAVHHDAAFGVVSACDRVGVGYLDTAPLYGNGVSEVRLGEALAARDGSDFVISTKVGRTLDDRTPDGWRFDFSRDAVLRGIEQSLNRLQRDHVDILYVHDPDDHAEEVYRDVWPTLVALREQGVVGAIGFGMNQWRLPLEFVRRLDVDVVMLAGRYTLLDDSAADEFLPECQERQVGVVLAGIFNSGVLIEPKDGAWYDYAPASPEVLERARRIHRVAAEYDVPLAALALHFAVRHSAVSSVVVGAGSASTVQRNASAFAIEPPNEVWDRLRDERLIRF